MGHFAVKLGSALVLLILVMGVSLAGNFDYNPNDQYPVKHKNDVTSDVSGTGYMVEYTKVNTNNLSMMEYAHGSGTLDLADVLYDEQKSTGLATYIYYIDYDTGQWKRALQSANSAITYTRQYDNVQSPTSFAYGTGWYAAHPVTYNSLLKDKNEAKSYQESVSMHRQVEYARAVKGDIAVDMNCTGPTATTSGAGTISMKTDDEITQGTLHVGELMGFPMKNVKTTKVALKQGIKEPIILLDSDYVGDFKIQKTMKVGITKSAPSWMEDWLPCCSGSFFDVPSYNFEKEHGSQKGIFDCTCRNTSISTMLPKWNTTLAQFPTEKYQYKP
ncbi:Uncharacterised protein [uncultured archaeon]|nr:Uncharacterised protein [uncultured archaeon]